MATIADRKIEITGLTVYGFPEQFSLDLDGHAYDFDAAHDDGGATKMSKKVWHRPDPMFDCRTALFEGVGL
ncbi:hypothetical protein [Paraburkholderia sartisoli]|uniref:hypothetical protein n=1 Tax=Paraburkholderia sartisoli TaxID=83784 RepID=UPI001160E259|nr:hypothetical protein [Paraburkholderia sartisoli]